MESMKNELLQYSLWWNSRSFPDESIFQKYKIVITAQVAKIQSRALFWDNVLHGVHYLNSTLLKGELRYKKATLKFDGHTSLLNIGKISFPNSIEITPEWTKNWTYFEIMYSKEYIIDSYLLSVIHKHNREKFVCK